LWEQTVSSYLKMLVDGYRSQRFRKIENGTVREE